MAYKSDPANEALSRKMREWNENVHNRKMLEERDLRGSKFVVVQLIRNKIRDVLNDRLACEQHAATSAATTMATHLIPDLKKETEKIFEAALA